MTQSIIFRKLVGKYADLDFITAPHLIPSDNPDEQVNNIWLYMVLPQIVALNHHIRINMDGGSANLLGLLMLMKTPTVT